MRTPLRGSGINLYGKRGPDGERMQKRFGPHTTSAGSPFTRVWRTSEELQRRFSGDDQGLMLGSLPQGDMANKTHRPDKRLLGLKPA
jgi:hypothetical protein